MKQLEWVELPPKVGYEEVWDEAYELIRYEFEKKLNRYPGDLALEWEPYWYWQKIHPLVWRLRQWLWHSKPVRALWDGYTIHETDWVPVINPRGYITRKQVTARTPLAVQRLLAHFCKHAARCWGIGHFLEAISLPNLWFPEEHCPNCGYYVGELDWNPWFRYTHGGTSFNGDYTSHWFEGFWDCPRCIHRWSYGDSD